MNHYLAIKLHGVMQAWGGHTYEDLRHSELIPTRSAVLGLLAACLGIDRNQVEKLEMLSSSVRIAVRIDEKKVNGKSCPLIRIMDFHTVMDARKVDGKANKNPVVSKREYLCDAEYTLMIQSIPNMGYSLAAIEEAVRAPIYTPFLGRRSCPLSRPLFDAVISAVDFKEAFAMSEPVGGVIYSEAKLHATDALWRMRDEPVYARKRQFATRSVYIHATSKEE
jgi:CRISPR system Cascade subunit CasD